MIDLSSTSAGEALAATAAAGSDDATLAGTPAAGADDATLAGTPAAGLGDETLAATPGVGRGHAPAVLERGTLVSRYVVLSKLGAGGMGVVFAAYDPELDRKVALKLLHPRLTADADPFTARDARARLVREAQALARLNHPHIVAIHDVGELHGSVWLAMEYVDGETLSAWSKQRRRTWREVLAVMTAAARGLSAAHDAGLVHRDIKPDNIMVGHDGRVRVMDLGLARALRSGDGSAGETAPDARAAAARDREPLAAQVTRAGDVMGTPAYMSPEQFRGLPVDARADVFSWSATLWEALMGERPFAGDTMMELAGNVLAGRVRPVPRDPHARRVPGWLRRVCLRGLDPAPERRFAAMKPLLDALSQAGARAQARKWLVGAAAALTIGASAIAYDRHEAAGRVAACEDAGAGILDVWTDEARASVREGILATGLAHAPVTADKVMPFLDAHAEAWREHRTRACMTLAGEPLERAVWCLDERRMELAALVTELARADAKVVLKAVSAAASLPPVSACTDGQVLSALPSPPPADARARVDAVRTTLSQARTLLAAGKYPEGLTLTRSVLVDDAHGWPPMTAAARQLEGELLMKTGAYAEAEAASLTAYMDAAKLRVWHVAAPAARDLVANVGYQQARHAEGAVWAGHAEVAISFAGDPLGLREADRLNNLANVRRGAGAYAEAQGLYERALALRTRALPPEHPVVAASLNNLAINHQDQGRYPEAKSMHERALAVREQALGPEHPDVAASLGNLAILHVATGAYAEAKPLNERALAIQEKALGPEHPDVAMSLSNLADVHTVMGAYAEAKTLHQRALALREQALGPEHPDVAASLFNLARPHRGMKEYAEARALCERARSVWEQSLGPKHPHVAVAVGELGALALALDQPAEALPLLERAIAIFDAHEGVQLLELETRFCLAQALVRTGGDRARALTEARKAAAGFAAAGGAGLVKLRAEVEAFLAEHGEVP